MMHFGHANALRQCKSVLGADQLVVGVHSDKEIEAHKGPPVMSEEERYRLVSINSHTNSYKAVGACKWVDEVVKDAPYNTELEWMDKYNTKYCAHGDDIVMDASGQDTYHKVKAAGRFKTVPRTEGVSTTDLVGRMLLMTKEHLTPSTQREARGESSVKEYASQGGKNSPYTGVSKFVPTTRKIVEFSANRRDPKVRYSPVCRNSHYNEPNEKVVYIDGGFDLFHVGHIDILQLAKQQGGYLIAGVYDDKTVNQMKGSNYPIMNLYERVLGVLSCKYVDEVIIGAPYVIPEELIKSMNIALVVRGSIHDGTDVAGSDHYAVPKKLGIYKEFPSPNPLTTSDIVQRIVKNRLRYEERNRKKEAKELAGLHQT